LLAPRERVVGAHLAQQLTAQLGRPFTATYVRVTLHRARQKFADLLIDEVAHSLESPSEIELVHEIKSVGFAKLCDSALVRRRQRLQKSGRRRRPTG
jgi:RNA polymerase sigma-70 factor (ECF subfamily)